MRGLFGAMNAQWRSQHQVWVFRTPPEKWKTECIAPKKRAKGFPQLSGGVFWGGRGAFCPFVMKSVNAKVCLKLLAQPCPFQQDNAAVHTASVVPEQYSISLLANPIEHVWVILKQQYPGIADTLSDPGAVGARLVEVLPKAWDSLSEQLLDNLYRWQQLLMPMGGVQGTEHVFFIQILSS